MVDRTLVLRKLAEFDEYHRQIAEYAGIDEDAYLNDWKTQRIVDRTLQIMIETCLDVGGHIIADEKLRLAENYADTFKVLKEASIIPGILSERLVEMARFRNLIVHHYGKIDPTIITKILHEHLDDLTQFKSAILTHIGKAPEDA